MERVIVSILIGISVFFMLYLFIGREIPLIIVNNLNFSLILGIVFGIVTAFTLYKALPGK